MVEPDGTLLLSWLRLLGWLVAVNQQGDRGWIGVAEHEDPVRGLLRVEATGQTQSELAWHLFTRALSRLERDTALQAA